MIPVEVLIDKEIMERIEGYYPHAGSFNAALVLLVEDFESYVWGDIDDE